MLTLKFSLKIDEQKINNSSNQESPGRGKSDLQSCCIIIFKTLSAQQLKIMRDARKQEVMAHTQGKRKQKASVGKI